MKSVMITFDQAFYERIIKTLDRLNCRGFSYFQQVQGRGSKTGEPHYGSHAWPSMCSAIITMVDDLLSNHNIYYCEQNIRYGTQCHFKQQT